MNSDKKYKAPNRETWVKGKLRQMSLRWSPRSEALKRARKERGKYQCAICLDLFKSHQVILDHINPVVPLTGPVLREDKQLDWNSWIDRLFCDVDGFQVICKTCDDSHTKLQDQMRVHYNNKRKLDNKTKK